MRMSINEGEKRYALLLAARDSDYVKKLYGGYFNVFVDALGEEGERWDLFRVVEGDFPDMNELENYEAFVVSGSPYDAYGDDNWILQLCFLLQTLVSMQKKVLGICFGHQVSQEHCTIINLQHDFFFLRIYWINWTVLIDSPSNLIADRIYIIHLSYIFLNCL